MEEGPNTFDGLLAQMREYRTDLVQKRGNAQQARDEADRELVRIDKELLQIDAMLGRDNGADQRNIQTFVLDTIVANYRTGETYKEQDAIAVCRRERPTLTERSIQSAIRRLAKLGRIELSGTRRNRDFVLLEKGVDSASLEDGTPIGRSLFDGAEQPS